MGGKQDWPRQHILLFTAVCLTFLITMTGCRANAALPAKGADSGDDQQEVQLLDRAESFLQAKEYSRAFDLVDQAIACCAGRHSRRALSILMTALTAPGDTLADSSKATKCFRGLANPIEDPFADPAAQCWAATLNEVMTNEAQIRRLKKDIQALEIQIERLKAVDLEPISPHPNGKNHE